MLGLGLKKKFIKNTGNALLFFQWLADSWAQYWRRPLETGKKALFVLDDSRLYRDDDDSGRYAYLILDHFSKSGYAVYLHKKIGYSGYLKLGKYGRCLYAVKNLKLVDKIPFSSESMVCVFDDEQDVRGLLKRDWKKLIYVNVQKSPECRMGTMVPLPYFMHPLMYRCGNDQKLGAFRSQPRRLRAFFGGNATPYYYNNRNLHRYGQLTRVESLEALAGSSDPAIRRVEDSGGFLNQLREGRYRPECALLKTDDVPQIPVERWLSIVASSDFFVCLAGTGLPMCHNAIESLAVGTIPILSYADWFFPPLEHRKNALIYSGKEDLVAKVREALSMSAEEIGRMRKNATEYYDRHLTPEGFLGQVEATGGEPATIMLYPRLLPTPEEAAEGRRLLSQLTERLHAVREEHACKT